MGCEFDVKYQLEKRQLPGQKFTEGIEWFLKKQFGKAITSLDEANEIESAPLSSLADAYLQVERSGEGPPDFLERKRSAIGGLRGILEDFDGTSTPLMTSSRILLCHFRPWELDEPEVGPSVPVPSGPVHVGGDVRKPEKLYAPKGSYTPEARRAGIEGVVIAQVIVNREGCVEPVKVLKGLPMGLSEAAIKTLKSWVFTPARWGTNPVAVYYNLTLNFRLR